MKRLLLDVNVLIAMEHPQAPMNRRFHDWYIHNKDRILLTCAITELGFMRVSMNAFKYTRAQALEALADIRRQTQGFIEHAPALELPPWTKAPSQITDAYLIQLAKANRARLLTFDLRIPADEVERIG